MMKKYLLTVFIALLSFSLQAQERAVFEPVPVRVAPSANGAPPSDAIVLFDGGISTPGIARRMTAPPAGASKTAP